MKHDLVEYFPRNFSRIQGRSFWQKKLSDCFRNPYTLMYFTYSSGLEITVGHWTLTDSDVILSNRTFLPLDTMTNDDNNLSFQTLEKFRCEIL